MVDLWVDQHLCFFLIFIYKMEFDVAVTAKSLFYKVFISRKKNRLYEYLNYYHENIKLTVEVNLSKFFDTELIR